MQQMTIEEVNEAEQRAVINECKCWTRHCVSMQPGEIQKNFSPAMLTAYVCSMYSSGKYRTFGMLNAKTGFAAVMSARDQLRHWAACGLERDVIEKCVARYPHLVMGW